MVAGTGSQGYSGDGGQATEAELFCPFGPAFDRRGMFILDHGNNRIRLVDATGAITTFAGTGPTGIDMGALEGDGDLAISARFNEPIGTAIDASGAIYIGDRDNHVVRRIDPTGIITTIAGTGLPGFSGDGGPATMAQLDKPEAIAVDDAGNVYVADTDNNRVRRIDPAGIITTVAGNGNAASDGDGGPASAASLNHPQEGLVIDAAGALYVTEGQRIRRIGPDRKITTYAGTGEAGHSGDGGPATAAQLQDPAGLAVDRDGVLYLSSDGYAPACVRSIAPEGVIRSVWCHPWTSPFVGRGDALGLGSQERFRPPLLRLRLAGSGPPIWGGASRSSRPPSMPPMLVTTSASELPADRRREEPRQRGPQYPDLRPCRPRQRFGSETPLSGASAAAAC